MTRIEPGTVVDYHGSKGREHGRKVIIGWAGGRLALMDPDYPGKLSTILRVRPGSVTLTGEHLPLCAECLCPVEARVEAFGDGSETWCWHCRESCRHHGECAADCDEHPHRHPYEHGWDDVPFPVRTRT